MLSRRIFLQGAAGALTVLSTGAVAGIARAATVDVVTIDSVETPLATAAEASLAGHRHVRLSGTQLERYNTLKALFGSASGLHVRAHLDHAAQVLLDTALNETGRAIIAPVRRGASIGFVVKAA
ncbi:hypothetical protein FHS82_003785 [Pseudochelatococcus lubricantis]|uniref:Uncharacterized protein n=1 Tax=Pseudochelatococcus lubricantis TaxID=1538102 RepID=A0ABX0V602_9HYPH|nr:hypothetical protein [Pseudochelatococcus lubricantis]NIJ59924.1 hypothetical protein [Pseudochelatococcus lubricantis]